VFGRGRPHPLVQALKFTLGLGAGLIVGSMIAVLLAPAAGEDTRRRLLELVQGEGDAVSANESGGLVGLLKSPRARIQLAIEEARKEREARERELLAEFQAAKRTGARAD
jgi:gas vesicle protein